jgi:hypothetical protein
MLAAGACRGRRGRRFIRRLGRRRRRKSLPLPLPADPISQGGDGNNNSRRRWRRRQHRRPRGNGRRCSGGRCGRRWGRPLPPPRRWWGWRPAGTAADHGDCNIHQSFAPALFKGQGAAHDPSPPRLLTTGVITGPISLSVFVCIAPPTQINTLTLYWSRSESSPASDHGCYNFFLDSHP